MPPDPGYTLTEADKARLLIRPGDLTETARELRDLLAGADLFDRNGPVRLVRDPDHGGVTLQRLGVHEVVHEAHRVAQPVRLKRDRKGGEYEADETLPERVAHLYLALGAWNLRPLRGIAYAPLVNASGIVRACDGYDAETKLWCANIPDLGRLLPDRPTRRHAEAALAMLRRTFRTFPFADAPRCAEGAESGFVDLSQPPAADESGFLAGLLTAVCRPSLDLAPGLLIRAPSLNGSGTGKGLLARAICMTAFNVPPQPFTGGADERELEKRLVGALLAATPAIFVDNLNGVALQSDQLANVLTESPACVRLLGTSEMARISANSFVVATGNGLSVSEDLVRRFVTVELDARSEDPETCAFPGDFLADVMSRRAQLLAAALTVVRWGRQHARKLSPGAPLGGFQTWCSWVRDPLLALGCADPVARISEAKAADNRRQDAAELFQTWRDHHGEKPLRASDLHPDVRAIIDPLGRGRQYIARQVAALVGTRIAGLTLSRSKSSARWSTARYAVLPSLPLG